MTDHKNFRAQFLERVGIKGGEQKKILESLIQEPFVDVAKVSQFCIRMSLPAMHRTHVWKLLLDLSCPSLELLEFCWGHKVDQFIHLRNASKCISECNPAFRHLGEPLQMFIINNNFFPGFDITIYNSGIYQVFSKVYKVMCSLDDNEITVFWLAVKFTLLLDSLNTYFPTLVGQIYSCLAKEETDHVLYNHIKSMSAVEHIPIMWWLQSGYSTILPGAALSRIWDKILAGSSVILLYTIAALLFSLKKQILLVDTPEAITHCLKSISEESAEGIVNLAIEMWQRNGSLHHPEADNPKALV